MRILLTDELLDSARTAPGVVQAYLWDTEVPRLLVVIGPRSIAFSYNWRDSQGRQRRKVLGRRGARWLDGGPLTLAKARSVVRALKENEQPGGPTRCPTCGHKLRSSRTRA